MVLKSEEARQERTTMNLVTDPWVPVLLTSGKPDSVSLMHVFTNGREYRDLAVRPHERIALMRFLICVAQAALDGPADTDEWDQAPVRLPDAAAQYLTKWKSSFNLFDSQKPFLQIAKLAPIASEKDAKEEHSQLSKSKRKINQRETKEDQQDERFVAISKLDFSLATGNNPTLYDHEANGLDVRSFEPAWIALGLLTFQSFSSSGTIGVAQWGASRSTSRSSAAAPCLHKLMLHSFIRRASVFETVCANLLTKKQVKTHLPPYSWGQPIWEHFPSSADDERAVENATETYLGRLVPVSRWARIKPEGAHMILANGFAYPAHPNRPAEPSAIEYVKKTKKGEERALLRADDKAMWRQLPAILVRYRQKKSGRGALCLDNQGAGLRYDLWIGGLIWSSSGGYEETVESVLPIDPCLQTDAGVAAYESEVIWAKRIASNVGFAVETYRRAIDGGWEGRLKTAKNKGALKGQLCATATRHYWTSVEKLRPLLVVHVEAVNTSDFEPACDRWRSAVHAAARDAYGLACGRETPRQIRAFALGWKRLFAASASDEKRRGIGNRRIGGLDDSRKALRISSRPPRGSRSDGESALRSGPEQAASRVAVPRTFGRHRRQALQQDSADHSWFVCDPPGRNPEWKYRGPLSRTASRRRTKEAR